jgi:hypothetical protein
MIFSDWVTAVTTLLEYPIIDATQPAPTGTVFDLIYPDAIAYAELRMQRDIDFLSSVVTDDTGVISANQRKITYPTDKGHFVVVSQIIPIFNGVKQTPLEPVSRAFLEYCYPDDVSPGTVTSVVPPPYGPAVVYKTFADSPYTVAPTDGMIIFDATGGNCTANLPLAALFPYRELTIVKDDAGSNLVTPAATGADSIVWAGGALIAQGQTITLKSDGISRWIALHQVG